MIFKTITNSLKQSENVRQSILRKAFEGRLVKENNLNIHRKRKPNQRASTNHVNDNSKTVSA